MVDIVDCYRDVNDSKILWKNVRDGRNIMFTCTYLDLFFFLSILPRSLEGKGSTGWQVRGDGQVGGGTGVRG